MCGSQSLQELGQFHAVDFDHLGHEVLVLGLAAAHRVRQHPRLAASNKAVNLPHHVLKELKTPIRPVGTGIIENLVV
jgi:hypothetical protein